MALNPKDKSTRREYMHTIDGERVPLDLGPIPIKEAWQEPLNDRITHYGKKNPPKGDKSLTIEQKFEITKPPKESTALNLLLDTIYYWSIIPSSINLYAYLASKNISPYGFKHFNPQPDLEEQTQFYDKTDIIKANVASNLINAFIQGKIPQLIFKTLYPLHDQIYADYEKSIKNNEGPTTGQKTPINVVVRPWTKEAIEDRNATRTREI